MVHRTETVMPREVMPETRELFNTTEKIPPEKLYGFLQFMRGVNFGLDMASNETTVETGARTKQSSA